MKCAIISNSRGKDVKTNCLIKNGYFAPYLDLRREPIGGVATPPVGLVFGRNTDA